MNNKINDIGYEIQYTQEYMSGRRMHMCFLHISKMTWWLYKRRKKTRMEHKNIYEPAHAWRLTLAEHNFDPLSL